MPPTLGDAGRYGAKGTEQYTSAASLDAQTRALLEDPNLLSRRGYAMMANGWAGDWRIPQLAYVALTSRVLERPMKLAFVAAPAAGKNAALDAALTLVPPEAVYVSTAARRRP